MIAIHKAVIESNGRDYYTGEPLAWEIISTYDNEKSKEGRRLYKKSFWNLPTVDHFGEDLTANAFKICSWRTNDCKNDLSQEELIEFSDEGLRRAMEALAQRQTRTDTKVPTIAKQRQVPAA